jgi:diguanylate cyclase
MGLGAATSTPRWDSARVPPHACRHVERGGGSTVRAPAAGRPGRGQRLRSRTASRVALVGIAGVLLALTGSALWAAATTNQAALHAAELTHLNDAYQQARFAVQTEEGLEHKYRLEPGPEVRARFEQAARSLDAAVQFLLQHGDQADREPIATLTADHRRYLQSVRQEFAAVDAGDQRRVQAIEEDNGPRFEKIAAQVEAGAAIERDETLAGLAALRRHVVAATRPSSAPGLGCWSSSAECWSATSGAPNARRCTTG